MSRLWIILLFFVPWVEPACTDATASVPEIVSAPEVPVAAFATPQEEPPQELVVAKPWNPYANTKRLCEPPRALCETAKDCKGVFHPSGKKLKCVKAYWGAKICSPGWSNRQERNWRRDRLEYLVSEAYFSGKQTNKTTTLSKFLWLVYMRETTGRPWKRHRLNGDIRFARTEWYRQQRRYGWAVGKDKRGDISWMTPCTKIPTKKGESKKISKCRDRTASRFYTQRSRWEYGLGPYGQNAALWTATWDPQAPPEILCGEVESTEAYLRGARRVWKKLRGGIRCGGKLYQPEVTWEILHRGIAGGKLCPAKKPSEGFRRRARKYGLNPDQRVSLSMLGKPIQREQQNLKALEIYALLNAFLPVPGL